MAQELPWDVASLPPDAGTVVWFHTFCAGKSCSHLGRCRAISRGPRFDTSSRQRPFDRDSCRYDARPVSECLGLAEDLRANLPSSQRNSCMDSCIETPRVCGVLGRPQGAKTDPMHSGAFLGSHYDRWWSHGPCDSKPHQHTACRRKGEPGWSSSQESETDWLAETEQCTQLNKIDQLTFTGWVWLSRWVNTVIRRQGFRRFTTIIRTDSTWPPWTLAVSQVSVLVQCQCVCIIIWNHIMTQQIYIYIYKQLEKYYHIHVYQIC